MTDTNSSAKGGAGSLERFGFVMLMGIGFTGVMAWLGLKRVKFRSVEFQLLLPTVLLLLFALTFSDNAHLRALHWIWPNLFTLKVVVWLRHFPRWLHFVMVTILTSYTALCLIGLIPFIQRRQFQNAIETIGLKNAKGDGPKVSQILPKDDDRTRVLVRARGIGVDRFETKKADLESSFGQMIEKISTSQDRKTIEIMLCKKGLTTMVPFEEVVVHLKKPYTFLVGESANGLLIQDLRDLPHLLIAGTTGEGKSVFMRQLLVGLLQSQHLQMYLIDLKRGVEMKEFEVLPNVKIAKDEVEAVQVLTVVRDEMQRRFKFMEERKIKKIEPSVHKKDLIVLAIDEASVLYGKTSISEAKANLVAQARDLTDELAKLARAAGIHLVVATQKAIKESLDTKTLENLGGRMVFKMSTHAGSNTALGNVKAYALPDIKGRAIWAGGNKFIEVQAPYLSEEDLDQKCQALAKELEGNKEWNFQPMLTGVVTKTDEESDFQKMKVSEKVA